MNNNKHNHSWKERLQYYFDEMMSRGVGAMILLLIVVSLLIVFVFGVLLFITGNASSLLNGFWTSTMHIIDGGTITGDSSDYVFMFIMFLVTMLGLAVIGTLISIINSGIEGKLETLKKGKSKIIENDHIIILGFDSEIYTIFEELINANRDETKAKRSIVVLDNKYTPEEMEDMTARNIGNRYNTKIIFRQGVIYNIETIKMCSPETCKSVIVNVESDFETIKCILAVSNIIREYSNIHITAFIKNPEYNETAYIAGEGKVKIMNFEEIIGRIIAQSSRYPGASKVFESLFGFDGSEFYIIDTPDELVGLPINEINYYYNTAIFVGKETSNEQKNKEIKLYPELCGDELTIHKGDRLVFIAENSNTIVLKKDEKSEINKLISKSEQKTQQYKAGEDKKEKPKKILILRYSTKLPIILEEIKSFMPVDSKIIIGVKQKYEETVKNICSSLEFSENTVKIVKEIKSDTLNTILCEEKPDTIMVLSNVSEGISNIDDENVIKIRYQQEDAEIMMILLKLRSFLVNKNQYPGLENYSFTITSEIQYSEDQKLAQDTSINDFIVGSSLTNQILAQVAHEKDRFGIFKNIITTKGSDIIFKETSCFVPSNTELTMYEIQAAVSRVEPTLICIGYSKDGVVSINNEEKEAKLIFNDDDFLIFIGKGL